MYPGRVVPAVVALCWAYGVVGTCFADEQTPGPPIVRLPVEKTITIDPEAPGTAAGEIQPLDLPSPNIRESTSGWNWRLLPMEKLTSISESGESISIGTASSKQIRLESTPKKITSSHQARINLHVLHPHLLPSGVFQGVIKAELDCDEIPNSEPKLVCEWPVTVVVPGRHVADVRFMHADPQLNVGKPMSVAITLETLGGTKARKGISTAGDLGAGELVILHESSDEPVLRIPLPMRDWGGSPATVLSAEKPLRGPPIDLISDLASGNAGSNELCETPSCGHLNEWKHGVIYTSVRSKAIVYGANASVFQHEIRVMLPDCWHTGRLKARVRWKNSVTDLNRGGAPSECDCPIGPGFVVDARNPFAGDSVKVYAVSKVGLEEPVTVVVQAGDHADTLELKLESGAFPNRGGDQVYASSWPPDAGTKRRSEPIPHFVRLAPGMTAGGLHAGETSFTPYVQCNNLLGRKVVVFTNHKPAHWDWWGHSPSDAGGEIATRRKALYFTSALPGRSLKVTWKGILSSATPESAEPLDTAAALEPLPNLALEQQSEEAGQSTANGGAEAGRAWAYAIVQQEGFNRRLLSEWESNSSLTLNLTASARPRHPEDPEKEIALQDLDPVRGTARAETYHLRFLVESRDSDGNVAYHAITLPLQFQVDSPWRHYFQDGIVFILFLIPLVIILWIGTKRLIRIIDTGAEATKRVSKRGSLIPPTEGDPSDGDSSRASDPQKADSGSAASESGSTKTDDRGQRAARESGRTKRKWGRS